MDAVPCGLLRPAALAASLLFVVAGCAGKRIYPVDGIVQYEDGTPALELAGGTISLESVADLSNAAGEIQPDGTFRIQAPLGENGVPAGAYRVVILPPPGADRRKPPIDPSYGRYQTSGIEITVKEEPSKITVTVRRPARG